MERRVDILSIMSNNTSNALALDAASLCLDIEHGVLSANIAEALSDFLHKHGKSMTAVEAALIKSRIELLADKPQSAFYADWARTTLADIWRAHR